MSTELLKPIRGKTVVMFGSDGSQMEGDNAEAARYAVARNLKVKILVDDNNVTIAGHPGTYMQGYDVAKTLEGPWTCRQCRRR